MAFVGEFVALLFAIVVLYLLYLLLKNSVHLLINAVIGNLLGLHGVNFSYASGEFFL